MSSSSNTGRPKMVGFGSSNYQETRKRSGSFTANLDMNDHQQKIGHLKYSYSATRNELEVDTIANLGKRPDIKGLGGVMFKMAEQHGIEAAHSRGHESVRVTTATSQPGFFKKMNMVYSPEQEALNQLKHSPQELRKIESSPQEEGGHAFVMEKHIAW